MAVLRRSNSLTVALASLTVALCASRVDSGAVDAGATQEAPPSVPTMQTVAGAANSYGVDVKALKYEGSETAVLARMKGRPFIRARDYNAWLGTYPLNITSQDSLEGRKQALEQMAMFKLMLKRAKEAGYESKVRTTGGVPDDRSIVLLFIRDQISNITTVSDEMVRQYEIAHPERFPQGENRMPPEMLAVAVKGEIRGQQLTEEIRSWMKEEAVTLHLGRDDSRSTTKSK